MLQFSMAPAKRPARDPQSPGEGTSTGVTARRPLAAIQAKVNTHTTKSYKIQRINTSVALVYNVYKTANPRLVSLRLPEHISLLQYYDNL